MKLQTLLIAAIAVPLLAACADNDRYADSRGSSSYEQSQRTNDYNRSDNTFRQGQIEK